MISISNQKVPNLHRPAWLPWPATSFAESCPVRRTRCSPGCWSPSCSDWRAHDRSDESRPLCPGRSLERERRRLAKRINKEIQRDPHSWTHKLVRLEPQSEKVSTFVEQVHVPRLRFLIHFEMGREISLRVNDSLHKLSVLVFERSVDTSRTLGFFSRVGLVSLAYLRWFLWLDSSGNQSLVQFSSWLFAQTNLLRGCDWVARLGPFSLACLQIGPLDSVQTS